jgi:nitrogen fixation protein NifU and related proteins
MREDLQHLYQAVILDHARAPRNFRRLDDPSHTAKGHNPMCGDRLTVFLRLDADGAITDAAFEGQGCAIALASGSLMTELLRGRTAVQSERLCADVITLCSTGGLDAGSMPEDEREALQQLEVLSGVSAFPVRIRCATLAWHAMLAALRGDAEASSE